jgi:hypothetical protein
LKEQRVKVFALSPPRPVRQAGVVGLVAPTRAFLWEPFTVKGGIAASSRGTVTVVLRRSGVVIDEQEITVDSSGFAEAEFVQESDRVGTVFYSLELKEYDSPAVSGEVRIATSPRVRYIGDDLEASKKLIDLLRDAGIDVEVSRPSDLIGTGQDFALDDILLLDDLPSPTFGDDLIDTIRKAVGDRGKGLVVIGGRKGLGSEAYHDSLLESILPVTVGYSTPPEPPPVSLIIAMDTSFSMYFRNDDSSALREGGPRKIDVAKESSREVVKAVRPRDRLGILGNSTDLFWIQSLGHLTDREETMGKIDHVRAWGAGINFYSIVREAYSALRNDDSPIRHIVVFGDAEDIDQYEVRGEGHSFDLIRRMAKDGITLSVLAIGLPTDKDAPFLRTATLLGGGDFYLISDLRALPRYFVTEYRRLAARHYLEEKVRPVAGEFSPLLHGVRGPLPTLDGIATVTPRSGAQTPVMTDTGVPLVTLGQFGQGKTAVFASDNGYRWALPWLEWRESRRFWLQLLFSVAPAGKEKLRFSSLEADQLQDRILFHHRAVKEAFPTVEKLWLHRRGTKGGVDFDPVPLVRTGLTTYQSSSPLPTPGFTRYYLTSDGEGNEKVGEASLYSPPPVESLPFRENRALLEEIVEKTGGGWIAAPSDIASEAAFIDVRKEVLFILVVAAGMVFLLVEKLVTLYVRR